MNDDIKLLLLVSINNNSNNSILTLTRTSKHTSLTKQLVTASHWPVNDTC